MELSSPKLKELIFFLKTIFLIFLEGTSKIAPSKNTFSKLLPQKCIFLVAPSKNTFSKLLPQIIKNKCSDKLFKITPSKSTFFPNCSLKEDIFKIAFSRNIFLIDLIYSSSESPKPLEELSKSSIICLITFLLMYLYSFKNTGRYHKNL